MAQAQAAVESHPPDTVLELKIGFDPEHYFLLSKALRRILPLFPIDLDHSAYVEYLLYRAAQSRYKNVYLSKPAMIMPSKETEVPF